MPSSRGEGRLRYERAAPGAYRALMAMERYVKGISLPEDLIELVKIRASQINGCAYCLDMHTKDARALGVSEHRIYLLDAWRESPLYSERERAALEWTEELTLISVGHVPDEVYARVRKQFTEKELVELSLAIITINAWNRMSIAFRHPEPGSYELREGKLGATSRTHYAARLGR